MLKVNFTQRKKKFTFLKIRSIYSLFANPFYQIIISKHLYPGIRLCIGYNKLIK